MKGEITLKNKVRLDSCRWAPGDGGVITLFDGQQLFIPDLEKNRQIFSPLTRVKDQNMKIQGFSLVIILRRQGNTT